MNSFLSKSKLVLLIFGILFLMIGGGDFIDFCKTPGDFDNMLESEFESGQIVEGNIYGNYGVYQESYKTNYGIKTGKSKFSYVIPVGEEKYMGFEISEGTKSDILDKQTDETYDYILGDSDEMPQPYYFKGKVVKMSSKTKGFFRQFLLESGFSEEEVDDYILPYYIVPVGNLSEWILWCIVGLLLIILAGIIFVLEIKKKKEDKYIARYQNKNSLYRGYQNINSIDQDNNEDNDAYQGNDTYQGDSADINQDDNQI